jgi:hypothetical protein
LKRYLASATGDGPPEPDYVELGRNGETAGVKGECGLVASAGWQRERQWR